MIYVMSDIHGEYDKFIEMLNKIEFSKEDTLYILGDVLDRGDKPLDIIEYIIGHNNIELLRGNHEQMFLNWYRGKDDCWVRYNIGYTTVKQIENKQLEVFYDYTKGLYDYLIKTKLYKILEVNNKKFILIHAGLYYPENYKNMDIETFMNNQNYESMLWNNYNIYYNNSFKDYITIQGHTTVQSIREELEDVFNNNLHNYKIINRGNNIYIDCGACFEDGKLSCLRLDDMKEFYV